MENITQNAIEQDVFRAASAGDIEQVRRHLALADRLGVKIADRVDESGRTACEYAQLRASGNHAKPRVAQHAPARKLRVAERRAARMHRCRMPERADVADTARKLTKMSRLPCLDGSDLFELDGERRRGKLKTGASSIITSSWVKANALAAAARRDAYDDLFVDATEDDDVDDEDEPAQSAVGPEALAGVELSDEDHISAESSLNLGGRWTILGDDEPRESAALASAPPGTGWGIVAAAARGALLRAFGRV